MPGLNLIPGRQPKGSCSSAEELSILTGLLPTEQLKIMAITGHVAKDAPELQEDLQQLAAQPQATLEDATAYMYK